MDNKPQGKEVALDVARELLIAISQSVPDNINLHPKSDKELANGHASDATLTTGGDSAEQLRSELISISYVPSPDKIVLPAMTIQD